MVREKIVYNGEAKWGPDRTCEQKRDCSGTSLLKCNWGADVFAVVFADAFVAVVTGVIFVAVVSFVTIVTVFAVVAVVTVVIVFAVVVVVVTFVAVVTLAFVVYLVSFVLVIVSQDIQIEWSEEIWPLWGFYTVALFLMDSHRNIRTLLFTRVLCDMNVRCVSKKINFARN